MGVNPYRVIAVVVMIDLILLLSMGFYFTEDSGIDKLTTSLDEHENWTDSFKTNFEDDTPDTNSYILEESYGDVRYGLGSIYNIMTRGTPNLNVDESTSSTEDTLAQYLTIGLGLFLLIINMFMILEVVYLIYGKKTG